MTKETSIALREYAVCRYGQDGKASRLAEFIVNDVMGHPSQLRYATPQQLIAIEQAKLCLRSAPRR